MLSLVHLSKYLLSAMAAWQRALPVAGYWDFAPSIVAGETSRIHLRFSTFVDILKSAEITCRKMPVVGWVDYDMIKGDKIYE